MTELIKSVVKEVTAAEQILLFGSRARDDFRPDSDYDVLAIVPHNLSRKERLRLSSRCRQRLAQMGGVDADVFLKFRGVPPGFQPGVACFAASPRFRCGSSGLSASPANTGR
jgi:predicted nucleotidyltransferase